MILQTKEDFESAILRGEEIKTKTVFYTGDPDSRTDGLEIGAYDQNKGIYCGELYGKQIWCDLHDAPKQMNWQQAMNYAKEKGGQLPSIDELTVVYLNRDKINKALVGNGGEPFKTNDYYWSSSENFSDYSWVLDMGSGSRYSIYKNNSYYLRCFQLLEN